ncbi:hypothetical protein DGMP_25880 [Desulfomarina profundi]|uniref:Uncharacterized protein n=1 Tax=Desulfomarina profundi TaxID=2772557 RepID=A0A8D5JQ18_9BACT|nr:hypothetical protein [Desulfomarina profundi]BCL61895.1 hypothetical protein DGMP_25880 [Desulfomarina profundi]
MDKNRKQDRFNKAGLGKTGYRPFWVLNLSIGIRAAHQVGAAIFLADYLINREWTPPPFYLGLVILSGAALVFTEAMRHRQLYREVSGICTIIKLLLLGAAFHGILPAKGAVLTAFILASISSHAPKMFRHRLLF